MDAEVYWNGRLIGQLCNVAINQPYYEGEWVSSHDAAFEQKYREVHATLEQGELEMIPVTFRAPGDAEETPVAAMVHPTRATPYFRFGGVLSVADQALLQPQKREPRQCQSCGQPITPQRLSVVPAAVRCLDCQVKFERAGG